MKIYLAGPLGFSEAGRDYHSRTIIPAVTALGHAVLDPWVLTDLRKIRRVSQLPYGAKKQKAWRQLNAEMAANNKNAIYASDAVFAVLDGADVDSGTAAEIGYAYALGKPILGYRGDFRLSADNEGSTVNLQVEFFIRASGGDIITTIDDLPSALEKLFRHSTKEASSWNQ
jgi:nucleoside 2-deoxyribosyltransferase